MVATKFFYPYNLNKIKEDILFKKAFSLRLVKNYISETIFYNINKYKDFSKHDLIKELAPTIHTPFLVQKDVEYGIAEVWTTYRNKIELINKKIIFKIQSKIIKKFYKKTTKNFKKGDIRVYEVKLKSTKFTKVMSYLARYGYKGIYENIKSNLENGKYDEKKILFFQDIIYFIDKYSEERLLNLAFKRRYNNYKKYNKTCHKFISLSFSTQTRINTNIANRNKNKESKIKGFINIGGYKQDIESKNSAISIPVKLDNSYHLNLNKYSKVYTIQFNDKNKFIRINLTQDIKKTKPTATKKVDKIIGVDINTKNNLFATSDKDIVIDYDRELFSNYVKFLNKIDNRPKDKNNKTKRLGKQNKLKFNRWQARIQNMIIEKSVLLIKKAKVKGYTHLVLEDLELISKLPSTNEEFDIDNGRLIRLLNLSSIKHRIENLSYKYNINISFIHPHYTSQTCDKCGSISKTNRKTQEVFKCCECGYKPINADYNSAINIKNRISQDVLRDKLLTKKTFNNYSEYEPKSFSKEKIKTILEDYYRVT